MLSETEFRWIEQQTDGDYDHLLVGSSLPWLLPHALHDLEAWDERLASGTRGRLLAGWAEKLRRAADLEHWAAFRESFDRLTRLFSRVGRGGPSRRAPATISVLSGDVHHAYAARARFSEPMHSRVYQLTCSPLHNYIPATMKLAFRSSWTHVTGRVTHFLLNRVSTVAPLPVNWHRIAGPFFGNQVATLRVRGPTIGLVLEQAGTDSSGHPRLRIVADIALT